MQAQVRSAGQRVRRFLWRDGRGSDSRAILGSKTEEVIQERDPETRPLGVVEAEEKLQNMKMHIGGVILICNDQGHTVDDLLAYGLLLNAMACNEGWIAAGDVNKDGIFHVHCICKTGVRSDSWKRTMLSVWDNIHKQTAWFERYGCCSLDVIKSQRVHRWSALMQYIMKNPTWVLANREAYLQMSKDITEWGLSKRFQTDKTEEQDFTKANPMVEEILTSLTEFRCKTMEDFMKTAPNIALKYLHRPGFPTIVQNCLAYLKATGSTWSLRNFARYAADPGPIHAVILTQGIEPAHWDRCLYQWITKSDSKRNTIYIEGPSNTGKTSLFLGLKQVCPYGEIVNGLTFNFEALVDAVWGLWDEPLCAPEVVEKFKQISGGETTQIPIKFKKPVTLPRTPILVCTNTPIWRWCPNQEPMLKNRMFMFAFNNDVSSGVFYPRCVERSCKCDYCAFSRRRTGITDSTTDTGSMPESEQPGSSREHMDSGNENPECSMGTRPMSGRTGTSRSTDGCGSGGRGRQSSHTTTRRSSSSSTSSSDGSSSSNGSSHSRKRIRSSRTRSTQSMGTTRTTRDSKYDHRRMGSSRKHARRRHDRGHFERNADHTYVVSMGGTGCNESEMDVQIPSQEQQMDQQMATLKLVIPGKNIWCNYLSYLWHTYHEQPITNLTCHELLPPSDSD
uniref:Nonstructural protein n=1 Tax=Parvoviridae sp. TaxID=1940570 RepID=A0A7D3UW21_9VIRU|nr:MAG: nonstructural protein [Parvoviridae sp.]